jgi:hypothetical protein
MAVKKETLMSVHKHYTGVWACADTLHGTDEAGFRSCPGNSERDHKHSVAKPIDLYLCVDINHKCLVIHYEVTFH